MLRPASGSVPSLRAHLFRCSSPHVDTTITACCTAETRLKRCSPAPSKAVEWEEAQTGAPSSSGGAAAHPRLCGMLQGEGVPRGAASQLQLGSFCLAACVLPPAAGCPLVALLSPVTTYQTQQQATPSSPSPWEKGVAGTLCKSKYLHSRGLPSPALDFLPLLKMSQISCFHNWAGNEFPAGWQLNTLVHHGSNICLCCLPPRAPGIFRGTDLARKEKEAGMEQHNYSALLRNPIPWSTGQFRIPGDPVPCLCHCRANIHSRTTQLPACTQQRVHSGNSGIFQARDSFFVLWRCC